MNCSSCGLQLPPGAANCPRCGAVTPYYYANTGATPNDATFVSTPNPVAERTPPTLYGATPPAPAGSPPYRATPAAQYAGPPYETTTPAPAGLPPYGAAPQNPYSTSPYAPYSSLPLTPTPPSLPTVQRSGNRIGIIVGAVVLVLIILIGSGVFAFLQYSAARNAAAAAAQATATAHAQATATATAIIALQNPYTHSGTLALSDPLSDNSKGHGWSEDAPNCAFTGGAYHVIAPDARYADYCLAGATNFSDFAFEAQMQIIKGDSGGLDFRVTSTNPNNEYYEFAITQDGYYNFYLVTGNSSSDIKTLTSGSNPAIHQGLNQANLIAVVAKGHSIMLYVNQQPIDKVTDSTYTGGQIGFDADPILPNGHPTEVVFSNAKVWTL
jgi:type II secretory pathway pseudopilin PulG